VPLYRPDDPEGYAIAGAGAVGFLGSGNFGDVWRAKKGSQPVVLKFMVNPQTRLHSTGGQASPEAKKEYHNDCEVPRMIQDAVSKNQGLQPYAKHFAKCYASTASNDPQYRNQPVYVALEDAGPGCKDLNGWVPKTLKEAPNTINAAKMEDFAKQLFEALALVHHVGVVHQDTKPENIMITKAGVLWLVDFGRANRLMKQEVVVGRTYTTCGTPDYFAPELVASQGHTHALDWWTLGILTFELLAGHPPFEAATPMQTYAKVSKGINRVRFPKKCKDSAGLLITGLCASSPSERLPMKRGGVDNVKEHEWFRGFSWQAMADLTAKPPFVPVVKDRKDAANFSATAEDRPPLLEYVDDHSGWDADFATSG